MEFWIDVEDATGNKLGAGPITSATEWRHTPRLDGAGEFSFSLPVGDPKSALLQNRRVVRCWAMLDGAATEMGAGIIDSVRVQVGEPTMLQVSGPDIMAELATRIVHDLRICEQAWVTLDDPERGMLGWFRANEQGQVDPNIFIPLAHDGNDVTYEDVNLVSSLAGYPESGAWLYVGYDARFDRVYFDFIDGYFAPYDNNVLQVQYYNGEMWATLTVTDFTDDGTGTWKRDGYISFTRPADWTRYTAAHGAGNWFWVRMRVKRIWPNNPSSTGYVRLAEVYVWADVPTDDGVNQIMAYAPSTWTRTGYPATVAEKYLEFSGETVLAALIALAEQGGQDSGAAIREHFRLGTGRAISWLGTTQTHSGVRAVAPTSPLAAEGAPEIAVISQLAEETDTADLVTRLYPESADGITLKDTTRSAPSGFTLDAANNYIQHTAGYTAYGLIEASRRFDDVYMQQADSFTIHPEYTANALFDQAVEWLRTRGNAASFYQLAVVQFPELLRPGDLVDVVYHEYVDGVHVVAIDTVADDAPLHILAPTLSISAEGIATVELEVATVDRELQTDAAAIVNAINSVHKFRQLAANMITYEIANE